MSVHRSLSAVSASDQAQDKARAVVQWYVTQNIKPGTALPSPKQLALTLSLPAAHVRQALRHRDTAGEIALDSNGPATRLHQGEAHPCDRALQLAVQERISTGHYQPGQALPTGLLSTEFRLQPHQVQRALGHLAACGDIRRDEHGPYGPGHYVPSPGIPRAQRRTRVSPDPE
ncbi:hypothetical protein [Streptomyces sp. NPDC048606]|uniref:hypothetical protein n=1 Tax=Streptomyces sp. NPDC048606 TaxID=3154726 RepID=UPI0034247E37